VGFVHTKKIAGKKRGILFFAAFFLLDAFLDDITYCLYIMEYDSSDVSNPTPRVDDGRNGR